MNLTEENPNISEALCVFMGVCKACVDARTAIISSTACVCVMSDLPVIGMMEKLR